MINETFTTHITFSENGGYLKEDPITGDKLASTIARLCDGPAAIMGMIERVVIVDVMDRVCVEIEGRNIVYPYELSLKQRTYRIAQKRANKSK